MKIIISEYIEHISLTDWKVGMIGTIVKKSFIEGQEGFIADFEIKRDQFFFLDNSRNNLKYELIRNKNIKNLLNNI